MFTFDIDISIDCLYKCIYFMMKNDDQFMMNQSVTFHLIFYHLLFPYGFFVRRCSKIINRFVVAVYFG